MIPKCVILDWEKTINHVIETNWRNMNMEYGFDNNIVSILNFLFLLTKKKKNSLPPPLPETHFQAQPKNCISPICKPFEQIKLSFDLRENPDSLLGFISDSGQHCKGGRYLTSLKRM